MEYNPGFFKKGRKFATTWMNLEGIMLSEISQTKNNKCYTISLICGNLNKS